MDILNKLFFFKSRIPFRGKKDEISITIIYHHYLENKFEMFVDKFVLQTFISIAIISPTILPAKFVLA